MTIAATAGMEISVLVLTLAIAGIAAALAARSAVRSMGATFDVAPVSDYWLAERKRAREEGLDR